MMPIFYQSATAYLSQYSLSFLINFVAILITALYKLFRMACDNDTTIFIYG